MDFPKINIIDNNPIITSKRGNWNIEDVSDIKIFKEEMKNQVKNVVERKGGVLLDCCYENEESLAKAKCSCGNVFEHVFRMILAEIWCKLCVFYRKCDVDLMRRIVANREGQCFYDKNTINRKDKIKLRCKRGHNFEKTFASLLSGYWCEKCFREHQNVRKEVIEEMVAKRGGKIFFPDGYSGTECKCIVICSEGHEWPTWVYVIIRGSWCGNCEANRSRGEDRCLNILKDMNIPYKIHDRKPWLKESASNYDFGITYNDLNCVIEFDGEMHFKYIERFHRSLEKYENGRQRDYEKTILALKNNHKVIRIDHTCLDYLENILKMALDSPYIIWFSAPGMYSWIIDKLSKEGIHLTTKSFSFNGPIIRILN